MIDNHGVITGDIRAIADGHTIYNQPTRRIDARVIQGDLDNSGQLIVGTRGNNTTGVGYLKSTGSIVAGVDFAAAQGDLLRVGTLARRAARS